MRIGPIDSGGRPLQPNDDPRRKDGLPAESTQQGDQGSTNDSVEISRRARELAQQNEKPASPHRADVGVVGQTADQAGKIDEIRKRIAEGYYKTPKVIRDIARRIADDFKG
jgi:hypothetical protein